MVPGRIVLVIVLRFRLYVRQDARVNDGAADQPFEQRIAGGLLLQRYEMTRLAHVPPVALRHADIVALIKEA